jgi:hypothetical protein
MVEKEIDFLPFDRTTEVAGTIATYRARSAQFLFEKKGVIFLNSIHPPVQS